MYFFLLVDMWSFVSKSVFLPQGHAVFGHPCCLFTFSSGCCCFKYYNLAPYLNSNFKQAICGWNDKQMILDFDWTLYKLNRLCLKVKREFLWNLNYFPLVNMLETDISFKVLDGSQIKFPMQQDYITSSTLNKI